MEARKLWEAVVPTEVGMASGTEGGRKGLGMKLAIMSLQACVVTVPSEASAPTSELTDQEYKE